MFNKGLNGGLMVHFGLQQGCSGETLLTATSGPYIELQGLVDESLIGALNLHAWQLFR